MNEKIKLLIAMDTYYPQIDGIVKFVEEFTKRAGDQFEPCLLVPNFKKNKDTAKVKYLNVSKILKASGYPSIKCSISNIKKISKAVKESDLVFIQGAGLISFISIISSNIQKKRCVYYVHINPFEFYPKFLDNILTRFLYLILVQPFIKKLLNKCSSVLIPYNELSSYLKREGVKTEINVARLGVDIDRFKPPKDKQADKGKLKIGSDKIVIGYVGRISKEKNTHLLLEAFKKLDNQKNLILLMVGDGPEDQTKKFKEIKNCKVTGFVSNVQDYLKAMDIFVMPSLTETTSLATLEAMSSGLPVIATKVGFIKKYLVRGHNGIFFPRNSSTMLSIKLTKLRKDKQLREKLGRHARRTVAYGFSWERSINRIKRLLLSEYYKHEK